MARTACRTLAGLLLLACLCSQPEVDAVGDVERETRENRERHTSTSWEPASPPTDPDKPWSTSALMKQCLSQTDDIQTCNSLIQGYLRKERQKQQRREEQEKREPLESRAEEQRDRAARDEGGSSNDAGTCPAGETCSTSSSAGREAKKESDGAGAQHGVLRRRQFIGNGMAINPEHDAWISYSHESGQTGIARDVGAAGGKVYVRWRSLSAGKAGKWSDVLVALDLGHLPREPRVMSPPAVIHERHRRQWIMWLVLSQSSTHAQASPTAPPRTHANSTHLPGYEGGRQSLSLVVAESSTPDGPFQMRSITPIEGTLSDFRCCDHLVPVPTGPRAVVLLASARIGDEAHSDTTRSRAAGAPPLLLNLTSDLLGLDSVWQLEGARGTPLLLARHDGIWHILAASSETGPRATTLSEMLRNDALFSSPNLHPGAIWTAAGRPSQVRVFRADGEPLVVSSLFVNALVGCVLLQHANGKTAMRCGQADDLFPGASSAW